MNIFPITYIRLIIKVVLGIPKPSEYWVKNDKICHEREFL